MNETAANAIRAVVIFQLAATSLALLIVMAVKRNYYFAARKFVSMVLCGMILICVEGARFLIERMDKPLSSHSLILLTATLLISWGLIGAFLRNKVRGDS